LDGLSSDRDSQAGIVHIIGPGGTPANTSTKIAPDHFWTKVRIEKSRARAHCCFQKGTQSLEEVGLQRANDLAGAPPAEAPKRRLTLVNRITIIVVLAVLSWLVVYGLLKLIGIV
jgi:hypothetical protein